METGRREAILRKYFEAVEWIEWNPDLFSRKFGVIQRVLPSLHCFRTKSRHPAASSKQASKTAFSKPKVARKLNR